MLNWTLLFLLYLKITVIMCWINNSSPDKCVKCLSDISLCYLTDKNVCFWNLSNETSCFGLHADSQETAQGQSHEQKHTFLCQLIKQSSINLDSMKLVNEATENVFNSSYLVKSNNMGEKECLEAKNKCLVMMKNKGNILCNVILNNCIKNPGTDIENERNVTDGSCLHDNLKLDFINKTDPCKIIHDEIHGCFTSGVAQILNLYDNVDSNVQIPLPNETIDFDEIKEIYHNDKRTFESSFDCDCLTVINVMNENSTRKELLCEKPCVLDYNNSKSCSPLRDDNNEFVLRVNHGKTVSGTSCHDVDHKFTFVTALFDLHRDNWPHFQRNFEKYMNYSTKLLNMNAPLVAFVDQSVAEFVRQHRKSMEHITQIIEMSLEDFELYQDYSVIKNIMDSDDFKEEHAFLHHPEGFSPEYNILMNSKFSMLNIASKNNYFNSTHFFWIDMGYGHSSDIYPKRCDWAPNNLMYNESVGDKITYIQLNPVRWLSNIHDIYKQNVPPFLNGGFFGGSMKAVQRYYHVHKDMFKLLLLHEMVDDDQTLAIVSYFEESELFNLVDGWWYDAFDLFH